MKTDIKKALYYYFKQRIGAVDYYQGWIQSTCPYCGRELKFGINLKSNVTNCFRCGAKPEPLTLVMELENFGNSMQAIEFLMKGNFDGPPLKFNKATAKESPTDLYLPKYFVNIALGSSKHGIRARQYLVDRGLNIDVLSKKGWGYCEDGDYEWYIIIPYMVNQKMVYYNARNFIGREPRYKNPPNDESPVRKNTIIYNADALKIKGKIYVCEGAINAVTLGDDAIACMGKTISPYQINKMITSQVKSFIILLDPDAYSEAKSLAWSLIHYKRVKLIRLPYGTDVNDLGRNKTLEIVKDTPYLTTNDLIIL
jgi:DNA primase